MHKKYQTYWKKVKMKSAFQMGTGGVEDELRGPATGQNDEDGFDEDLEIEL
jgi:hypothetical protein